MPETMDFTLVGGLTLSFVLTILTKVAYNAGLFVKYKKFTGIGLVAVGVLLAVTSTVARGKADFGSILNSAVIGIVVGLSAVGIQSTTKNAAEGFKQ